MAQAFNSWPTPLALKMYRIAKYKQRRELKSRPHLAGLVHIKIGGCPGLCACWIAQRLQRPAASASVRLEWLNTDASWTFIEQLSIRYNRCADRTESVRFMAPNIPGKQRGDVIKIAGQGDFNDLRAALAARPGYYFVELVFVDSRISHVCALYNGGTGLHFFDPNSGEYFLPKAGFTGFFRNLRTHYGRYINPDLKPDPQLEPNATWDKRLPQVFKDVFLIPVGV